MKLWDSLHHWSDWYTYEHKIVFNKRSKHSISMNFAWIKRDWQSVLTDGTQHKYKQNNKGTGGVGL